MLIFGKCKSVAYFRIFERNNINSRSVLRYSVITGIRNVVSDYIVSFRKSIMNSVKCLAVIVFGQIGNILEKNDFGHLCIRNSHDFKKQISPFIIEAFLVSAYRKRLTRKAGSQNIKIRNIPYIDFSYVSLRQRNSREIMSVCFACIPIDFICPYNLISRLFKRQIYSSDTRKQTGDPHDCIPQAERTFSLVIVLAALIISTVPGKTSVFCFN